MRLEEIGFYTLSDERVVQVSETSPMWRAEVLVTNLCNFTCNYCRHIGEYMPFKNLKHLIEIWAKDGLKNIRFSGGEPTFYGYLPQAVAYAKELGIERIAISTNGSNDREIYLELIEAGVDDFSISLDACCAMDGDSIAGIHGVWDIVVENIRALSKLVYVTVGIVVTPDQEYKLKENILFADSLGVSDIRIITSAQWDGSIKLKIKDKILEKYPILCYRVHNMGNNIPLRGLSEGDNPHCRLVIDDSAVMGNYHYPCIIYLREGGDPIGRVGPNMREERIKWSNNHNCFEDRICSKQCLDVCCHYNNRFKELNPLA